MFISYIVSIAFDALYVCASLEIMVGTIVTFTVHPSGTLLLTLVACPLILHSVVALALDIVLAKPNALLNANLGAVNFSASVLLGLFWLIFFVEIVILSFQPSVSSAPTPFNMENMYEPARGQLLPTDSQPALIRDRSDEESPLDGVIYSDRGKS
ncbi:hypothetical protein N7G274_007800 [Stereocaulon virgatum]|uniref:Uncharacterized protein n=1 Tax=Stereocaulon virgatum TaxID=373712 RepID=A0ABR4A3A5_9LECA